MQKPRSASVGYMLILLNLEVRNAPTHAKLGYVLIPFMMIRNKGEKHMSIDHPRNLVVYHLESFPPSSPTSNKFTVTWET